MEYSLSQVMFTLAWISYTGDLLTGGPGDNAGALLGGITAQLAAKAPVKDGWKVVWGPASFRIPGAMVDDQMLFVVQSTTKEGSYAIVIRGTNPASLSTWLYYNLLVSRAVPWRFGEAPGIAGAQISEGTDGALTTLLQMKPSGASPGAGKTLLELLSETGATAVTVTGHSLGGVLASTLGLALVNLRTTGVPGFPAWNLGGNAKIDVYSFAAPTAGNKAFAATTEHFLMDSLHRIYNPFDVVPHAWNYDTMLDVPDLYGLPDPLFTPAWLFMAAVADHVGYAHPRGADTKLAGSVAPWVVGFLPQAIYQHSQAYIDALDLKEVLAVSDVVGVTARAVAASVSSLHGAEATRKHALDAIGATAEVL